MERIYIDRNTAQFTRKGITSVDVTFSDGKVLENLQPRRLFPVSDRTRYVSLLDSTGAEQAVIRDLTVLPAEQQQIITECLEEYYLVPKILSITDFKERFDGITLYTETDHGPANIEIRTLMHGLRMDGPVRALVRDVNDNRYEIPDVTKLDLRSRQILARYL